jgi:hypothetical protein
MNRLEKIINEKQNKKLTENGDIAYKTTGNNLTDLFFMTPYFEKNLDQVNIGTTEKEKVFSMFIRDSRFGLGRRDLGRKLMTLSGVDAKNIVKAGRYDDLIYIPTDENIAFLKEQLYAGNELAKKWMPRLTGKEKIYAKALCKMWDITEKEYRKLIKTDSTVEFKLSYAEQQDGTPLNDLFKKGNFKHPLVEKIDFEKVPSLAMTKYTHTFSTREDLKERFAEYIQKVKENKAKINTKTTNVYDGYKEATRGGLVPQSMEEEAREVIANKIVDNATIGVEMDAIVILDSSGSMTWGGRTGDNLLDKAYSIAYGIAIKSTYAPNQVISFSSYPQLMTIKGNTLKEKYESMYTGDCSNTDFGKVMKLLQGLKKYPEYLIVLSDMEFDCGSNQSKAETMRIFKQHGANTKIVWWNLNDRNKTVPEFDNYGNIYLSGYNIQILKLLENKFDMTSYIDKILEKYKKDIEF